MYFPDPKLKIHLSVSFIYLFLIFRILFFNLLKMFILKIFVLTAQCLLWTLWPFRGLYFAFMNVFCNDSSTLRSIFSSCQTLSTGNTSSSSNVSERSSVSLMLITNRKNPSCEHLNTNVTTLEKQYEWLIWKCWPAALLYLLFESLLRVEILSAQQQTSLSCF